MDNGHASLQQYAANIREVAKRESQFGGQSVVSALLGCAKTIEDISHEKEQLRKLLIAVVNSKPLTDVRELVAGWNGENRTEGKYEPHPANLRIKLDTTAGAIYKLDTLMQDSRKILRIP